LTQVKNSRNSLASSVLFGSIVSKKCEYLNNQGLAGNSRPTQIGRDMTPHNNPGTGCTSQIEAGAPACLMRRERFLRACRCEPVDYPPVWMMRQAGRVLPEYRALKEKYSFLELAQTPELAAEVTLQPISRFDFDAAIIFSDILVVPEAMGQGYYFRESGGVGMDFALQSVADLEKLSAHGVVERLQYVAEAIRLVKAELGGRTALLGFAGSPWTLANFMLDGGSAKEHMRGLALFHQDRALFEALCRKLSRAIISFLQMQIDAGVDAVQIFDSHGELLPVDEFEAASGRWIREIVAAISNRVPVIVFSKGTRDWSALAETGAQVVGVDHGVTLTEARDHLPAKIALQGNLDPTYLIHEMPDTIRRKTCRLLGEMCGRNGHVFNLGHGVPPAARLENIQAMVHEIRGIR
jgi:uroporphyrinogen decarboxylase